MTEGKVQEILSKWFRNKDEHYEVTEEAEREAANRVDLLTSSKSDIWIVEVKGDYDCNVGQYQVNFDTALGQLLKSITKIDERTKYAIGIPFTRTENGEKYSYRLILPKYSRSLAFEKLNIHFLLVRDDGSVEEKNQMRLESF